MNAIPLQVADQGPLIRKFSTADLSLHGSWIVPRMMKAYPHLNERAVATFLQNIEFNNEYLFLFRDDSVALAQISMAHALTGPAVVYERFVWCKDPTDKVQQQNAAEFYVHIRRWAKQLGVEVLIVEESSDVPHDMIKEKIGRIFQRQQQFARL